MLIYVWSTLLFVTLTLSATPAMGDLFQVTGFNHFGNDVAHLGVYEASSADPAGVSREVIDDFEPPSVFFPDYHVESAAKAGMAGLSSRTFGAIMHAASNPRGGTIPVSVAIRLTNCQRTVVSQKESAIACSAPTASWRRSTAAKC